MHQSSRKARPLAFAAALLVISLVAASCASSDNGGGSASTDPAAATDMTLQTPAQIARGGTLKFGLNAETTTGWDPANSQWAGAGTIVARSIFDRITELDADGNPQPSLAESIVPNADFTEWMITLKPGITFHNGEPFNAAAVKVNLDRAKTSLLVGAAIGTLLDSVEVVDDLTVKVVAQRPWSTFPNSMATQTGAMAAPEQLNSAAPAQDPVGTGPFVFESWVQDSKLTVSKNPDYWGTDANGESLPYLDGIEFTVLADGSARGAALESGSVDAVNTFEPELISKFITEAQAGNVQLISNEEAEDASQFIGLNTAKPPFDDPVARELVVVGLDTQRISTEQYDGLYPPSVGFFPTGSPYFTETSYPTYDPARAQQLSDEYKSKHGESLSFTVTLPAVPQFKTIGEAAQAQASEFGVDIQLNLVDEATLIVDALTGNYEATGFITFGEPPIDQIFISSDTIKPLGQLALNFTRLADPEIQTALNAIQATDSETDQIEQWKIVQERMAQNLNMVFVVRNLSAVIYATSVFGMADATIADTANSPVKATASPFLAFAWKT